MTKDQRSEAQKLFEEITGPHMEEMEGCFIALEEVRQKFPDQFYDCVLYIGGKLEMVAEDRADAALSEKYLVEGIVGNA